MGRSFKTAFAATSGKCESLGVRNGFLLSSSRREAETRVDVVGGQDRAEGKRSQNIGAVGRAQKRSGRSNSMLEARAGNTSLSRSDTRNGRVAVVGETRRVRQQEDSVRIFFGEAVPRRGDEVRGGSSVPCGRLSQ